MNLFVSFELTHKIDDYISVYNYIKKHSLILILTSNNNLLLSNKYKLIFKYKFMSIVNNNIGKKIAKIVALR